MNTFNDWLSIFDSKNSSDEEKSEAMKNMVSTAASFHDWQEIYIRSNDVTMQIIRSKLSELKEML